MDSALIGLTTVLVLATIYYAWQTRRTVAELREARGVAILPRVTVSAAFPGPKFMWVVLSNNGIGPALRVDMSISYEPDGTEVRWKAPLMVAGERHRLRPPDSLRDPSAMDANARIILRGTYQDAIGESHSIDEVFSPKEHWDALVESNTAPDRDMLKEVKDELEKIRKIMERPSA